MNRLLILFCCTILSIAAFAQDAQTDVETKYNDALTLFDNGFFERCEKEIKYLLPSIKGMRKNGAYRLIALCRLQSGDTTGAKNAVEQLLKNDPYFTPSVDDPQRFIDLINESKSKEAGITTASRQSETVYEAPVAVTLITEEMIQLSGATTLQELLCLYVPGMTIAEGMETNIAMHGIYSLSQDKILFMVDGHRLNSSSTNAEAPDLRSSLDKIQQIEVLRGPASSLYGNVALTAVVNIITRKGAALNGGRISGIIGTQNTYGGSFVVGGGNNVVDVMGWGSMNYTKGFKHNVTNIDNETNTLYVQGYRGRPSYDIGLKGRWNDFTLSVNLQRSKRVPYLNVLQIPADQRVMIDKTNFEISLIPEGADLNAYKNFNYDSYKEIGGAEPGITRSNNRINLDYSHSFGKIDLQASGYISIENTMMYNALGDSIDKITAMSLLSIIYVNLLADKDAKDLNYLMLQMIKNPATKGAYQKMDWGDVTYGFQAQGLTNYNFLGNGSIVFGAQFEHFSLTSGNFMLGQYYSGENALSSTSIFKKGNEISLSGYAQIKHYFTPSLIINAGIRYDNKKRCTGEKLDRFSPRFSLIYKVNHNLYLRGNYNYSFVDAPYFYRACLMPMFGGGIDMLPETMNSFNIGASYHKRNFNAEIGAFYNILNDLCVINQKLRSNSKTGKSYMFINAGKVRTFGIDAALQYNRSRFFLNFNATWQRVITSEGYIVYNNQTFSTPAFHANTTVAYSPYKGKGQGFFTGGKMWLRGTAQFQTTTYYQALDLFSTLSYEESISEMQTVKPQMIVGLGMTYNWRFLDIDLSLKNIFNNEYKIGSMLIDGVPHSGRSLTAKITFKF